MNAKSELIKGIAKRITEQVPEKFKYGDLLLCEMAHICTKGDMMIWVWPREGKNIPHFHVGSLNYGAEWHSCIKFLEDEYFLHGGAIPLNTKQKKQMMEMLKDVPKDGPFSSYWETAVWQWNQVPDVKKIPYDIPIRDYDQTLPHFPGTKRLKGIGKRR